MLFSYLINEEDYYLKKVDDLNSYFEKYKGHEIKCKELKESLNKAKQKCEQYKSSWQESNTFSPEGLVAFKQDFRNFDDHVCKLIDSYSNLNQDLNALKLRDFVFLENEKEVREVIDQCWEEGYSIIKSDPKLQLRFRVEKNMLKQVVDINTEELKKDRQLIAEGILQELEIAKKGKKSKEVEQKLKQAAKLVNARQLFKEAKEKYCKLKVIFDQSIEALKLIQDQEVEHFSKSLSELRNEICKPEFSCVNDIKEITVQDPEKTNEIRKKILSEKEKRKEKGPLDVKREAIKEPKTALEKLDYKRQKQENTFSKIPLKHGQVGVCKDNDVLKIYQKCAPVALESQIIIKHLKDLLKLREENFQKERKNLSKEEGLAILNDIVPKKRNLINLEKAVDSKISYMESMIVENNTRNRNSEFFLKTRIKYLTQNKEKEISIITEDELYKKLEDNVLLLESYRQELEEWISKKEGKTALNIEIMDIRQKLEEIKKLNNLTTDLMNAVTIEMKSPTVEGIEQMCIASLEVMKFLAIEEHESVAPSSNISKIELGHVSKTITKF